MKKFICLKATLVAQAMKLSNHINAPQQPIHTINFRGGEIQQKARGIEGVSCGLINLISPEARSEVSSHAKAATSVTAKDLAKTLRV